jgi:hypothetical protein
MGRVDRTTAAQPRRIKIRLTSTGLVIIQLIVTFCQRIVALTGRMTMTYACRIAACGTTTRAVPASSTAEKLSKTLMMLEVS